MVEARLLIATWHQPDVILGLLADARGSHTIVPVNPRVETLNVGDRRIRILILDEDKIVQVQGETDRTETNLPNANRIVLQAPIHNSKNPFPESIDHRK